VIGGMWAVVEMLGHRQIIGLLSEETVAGATMLRVDTPSDPPKAVLVSAASLYAITPCTEEQARARVAPPRAELSPAFDEFVLDDDYDEEED
jgi:hypothetical protein